VHATVYLFGGMQAWPVTQLDDFYAASVVRPGVVAWEQLRAASPLVPSARFNAVQLAAATRAGDAAVAACVIPDPGEPLEPSSDQARTAFSEVGPTNVQHMATRLSWLILIILIARS
jgi:hypothetical protein